MKQVQAILAIGSLRSSGLVKLWVRWRHYRETRRRLQIEHLSLHLRKDLGLGDWERSDLFDRELARLIR
jgi:uncharacterized protein YjiS (DUF1127 family)